MRTALLLGTVAISHAAAMNAKHASFHARRNAKPVDYNTVNYENVNWSKALADIDWSTIFHDKPAPTYAPEVTHAPSYEVKPTAVPEKKKPAPKPAPEPEKEKPKDLGDVLEGIIEDISDIAKAVGLGKGVNSKEPNGAVWLGSSGSDYQITFINEASKDASVICWDKSKMWNIRDGSQVFTGVKAGSKVTVSVAKGFSGGCAPVFKDSKCSFSGIIDDSILEFTADNRERGVFQISREVTMKGVVMTATGSRGCVSGVQGGDLSCIFGCANGATTCGEAGSYNIVEGSDSSGYCSLGEFNGQPEGGCQFGADGEHIQVTFSDSRDWPSTVIKAYGGEYSKK
jgi:hypothetical protein